MVFHWKWEICTALQQIQLENEFAVNSHCCQGDIGIWLYRQFAELGLSLSQIIQINLAFLSYAKWIITAQDFPLQISMSLTILTSISETGEEQGLATPAKHKLDFKRTWREGLTSLYESMGQDSSLL